MYIPTEIIVIVVLAFILIIVYLNINFIKQFSKQQTYYKAILDTSTNIILLSNTKKIIGANKTFFNYFQEFKNIAEFSKEHDCICEYFIEEDGSLSAINGAISWREYLMSFQTIQQKIKMKIGSEYYYFLVHSSLINKKKDIYSLIFTDITEEEKIRHEIISHSTKDELTHIGNRKLYQDIVSKQITLAQRYVHSFSLILLDIDFFKKINDSLGHDIGNDVLKEYARHISYRLREVDLFCRIEGEMFAIILPYTTEDKAYLLAQKLRSLVEEHKQITSITMSFGVVGYVKGDNEETLFKRAQKALYKAKEDGRNRVVLG